MFSSVALRGVVNFLRSRADEIADEAERKLLAELDLDSYRERRLGLEETLRANHEVIDILVLGLQNQELDEEELSGSSQEALAHLVGELALRRAKKEVDFVDLFRAVGVLRREICLELYRYIYQDFPEEGSFAISIDRCVNRLFDELYASLAGAYHRAQSDRIRSQERALDNWDKVVKSAHQIDLTIPATEEFAATVRLQAEVLAHRIGFDESATFDIITSVGEVCDNSIEHGRSSQGIDISYEIAEECLKVTVTDYGAGFNPMGVGEELPDLLSESGRGIYLMNQLMDSVEIRSREGFGTTVVLCKKFAGALQKSA